MMYQAYFYLLILSSMCLDFVISQYSEAEFSYIGVPRRPVIPKGNRPVAPIHPITRKPGRRRPPGEGSIYLRDETPGRGNLVKSQLMELMGEEYKAGWMSAEKPKNVISVPPDEVDLERIGGRWVQPDLFKQARDLNLTAEFSNFEPELLPLQDQIRSWLLKRSTCPIQFTWKDLGVTYWPRWLRHGECLERKKPCSFPIGKHCVPGATTWVHILRWKCKRRKRKNVKREDSGSDTADKAIPKRLGRRRPKDESKHQKRVAERLGTSEENADETTNRRRVPDMNPEQKRRKRKRCNWEMEPRRITIECVCAC